MTKPNLECYFWAVLHLANSMPHISSQQIGERICSTHGFGTKVARQMLKAGLLDWLPDIEAYRINADGRAKLNSMRCETLESGD